MIEKKQLSGHILFDDSIKIPQAIRRYLYLGRVLWASAAQLMSQQAKSLKELTTSTYVV